MMIVVQVVKEITVDHIRQSFYSPANNTRLYTQKQQK